MGKWTHAYGSLMEPVSNGEKERGLKIDAKFAKVDNDHRTFEMIDAPGRHNYYKNLMRSMAMADTAVLVVKVGEF